VDNEFIQSGYRINHHTCWRSFKSLFTCHNESVNVWSHLLGSVFFFLLFLMLCLFVIPNQFQYGRELAAQFSDTN
jgi:adiponectin receptor